MRTDERIKVLSIEIRNLEAALWAKIQEREKLREEGAKPLGDG